ncbi:MAG: hypothetical protein D6706_11920 [Chloroflexi bacterium]|nr:MAG: hypothetical protein D6706_11920 [Chloroflexota bacterium]
MKRKFGLFIVLLILISVGLTWQEPLAAETTATTVSLNWSTPVQLSTGATNGARIPSIATMPDGSRTIVAFNRRMDGTSSNHDPYFVVSTNVTVQESASPTWSAPAPIYTSNGVDSVQVDVALDAGAKAHAVWVEGTALRYADETQWPTGGTTISAPSLPPGAVAPKILASGANTLDVVWAEPTSVSSPLPNIYHARSVDNGASWPSKNLLLNSAPTSDAPDIAIDSSGKLHVVWQENEVPDSVIKYVQGTPGAGNAVTWGTPVTISDVSNPRDAIEPHILIVGDTIHVIYGDIDSSAPNPSTSDQYIHHIQCSSNCTNVNNWVSTNNPVSGVAVRANNNTPFDTSASMVKYGRCVSVYFHGTDISLNNNFNEILWGIDSCGWSVGAPREQATSEQNRSLYPALAVANNWWLLMAYEQYDNANLPQIFFMRAALDVFLPTITRN